MARSPFEPDRDQTAIAKAYKNQRFIADEALPRIAVDMRDYEYKEYDLSAGFTVPNTLVGRKSRVNQTEFPYSTIKRTCEDFGIEDPVPVFDMSRQQDGGQRLIRRTTEMLTNIIMLDREMRVANLVFDATQYPTDNKVALAGTDVFDNPSVDPLDAVMEGMKKLFIRPNTVAFGYDAYLAFRRNPNVVKAVNGTSGDRGLVRRDQIAQLLEVDNVLVGESHMNVSRPGQTPTLEHIWGPHMAMYFLDPLGAPDGPPSFGWTAEFDGRVAGTRKDDTIGLRGAEVVRVGESVDEVLAAPMLGYLIENAGAEYTG